MLAPSHRDPPSHEGVPDAPRETSEQVPTRVGCVQESQPSPHSVLQHTPSTQFPDAHSQVLVQVLPSAFVATHAPVVVQKLPLLQ